MAGLPLGLTGAAVSCGRVGPSVCSLAVPVAQVTEELARVAEDGHSVRSLVRDDEAALVVAGQSRGALQHVVAELAHQRAVTGPHRHARPTSQRHSHVTFGGDACAPRLGACFRDELLDRPPVAAHEGYLPFHEVRQQRHPFVHVTHVADVSQRVTSVHLPPDAVVELGGEDGAAELLLADDGVEADAADGPTAAGAERVHACVVRVEESHVAAGAAVLVPRVAPSLTRQGASAQSTAARRDGAVVVPAVLLLPARLLLPVRDQIVGPAEADGAPVPDGHAAVVGPLAARAGDRRQ